MRASPWLVMAALAALLGPLPARAEATATLELFNRTPLLLFRADGTSTPATSNVVRRGEMLGFEFDFRMAVSDDGLPVDPPIGSGDYWGRTGIFFHGADNLVGAIIPLPVDSREIAYANLAWASVCGRSCAPWLTFAGPIERIHTEPDDLPQSITRSGHARLAAGLSATDFGFETLAVQPPGLFVETLAFSGVAPIPEPPASLLLALGLGALAAWRRAAGTARPAAATA